MEVDEIFFRKLKNGYRMKRPRYATNTVFLINSIFLNCLSKKTNFELTHFIRFMN